MIRCINWQRILAKRVHHFGTLLLVGPFPLLEYNSYIDDSVLDVDGVSRSRETENMETNNRPYLHPNSDANVINLGNELQVPRWASLNLLYFCRNLQPFPEDLCTIGYAHCY